MDILVSSNLERLIFHLFGNDAVKTAELMEALNTAGQYEIQGADADIFIFLCLMPLRQRRGNSCREIKRVYDGVRLY